MIAIPHGLAAEVLRALQDGPRTTGQIVDAIDKARGRGDEEPGVGLVQRRHVEQVLTFRFVTPTRVAWELRR